MSSTQESTRNLAIRAVLRPLTCTYTWLTTILSHYPISPSLRYWWVAFRTAYCPFPSDIVFTGILPLVTIPQIHTVCSWFSEPSLPREHAKEYQSNESMFLNRTGFLTAKYSYGILLDSYLIHLNCRLDIHLDRSLMSGFHLTEQASCQQRSTWKFFRLNNKHQNRRSRWWRLQTIKVGGRI